jgi:hypothetical protein
VSTDYLRRYTDIPALVSLLTDRKITLLDPKSWDDRNDTNFLRLYKKEKNLETLLALCFTQSDERYHHWSVFAAGSAGVCIRFDRAAFLEAVKEHDGIKKRTVRYLTLPQIRDETLKIRDLPFLKRAAFQDENEFRLIYESCDEKLDHYDIPIPLTCITSITLSPWLPEPLSGNLKAMLHAIKGCGGLSIWRSTIIENKEWHNHGKSAAHIKVSGKASAK